MLRDLLLPAEPPELELGIIELDDGTGSLAMRMRAEALRAPGVSDISDRGGWLRYTGQRAPLLPRRSGTARANGAWRGTSTRRKSY